MINVLLHLINASDKDINADYVASGIAELEAFANEGALVRA